MRILHYSLGLPPYRSGGMTTFCTDLIKQQIRDGHEVALIWPGRMTGKIGIRRRRDSYQGDSLVRNYELISPLPIPYDEGIKDFDRYLADGEAHAYEILIEEFKPDIFHVHTLMGLYKSFLIVGKEKGVRLVFTTHDFFSICPKVTMFRDGRICDSVADCTKCAQCNSMALSIPMIKMLQSLPYRMMKESKIVEYFRKQHRDKFLNNKEENGYSMASPLDYLSLRKHYLSMLVIFDCLHYNSTLTESIYRKYTQGLSGCVIPISHEGIVDRRKRRRYSDKILRIRYLGSYSIGKGYWRLKSALDKLWLENHSFRLDIHFRPLEDCPYLNVHDRYSYTDLGSIFQDTDILIVPSVWYETFGYTVLEALSYGVPVIISDTVGAKDIVFEGAGIVFSGDDLYMVIKSLTAEKLSNMNQIILSKQKVLTMDEVSNRIEKQLYRISPS